MSFKTKQQAMRFLFKQRSALHIKEIQNEKVTKADKTFDIRPLNLRHRLNYKIDNPVKTVELGGFTKTHRLIYESLEKGDAGFEAIEKVVEIWLPNNKLNTYTKDYVKTHLYYLIEYGLVSKYYVILRGRPHKRVFFYLL